MNKHPLNKKGERHGHWIEYKPNGDLHYECTYSKEGLVGYSYMAMSSYIYIRYFIR